MAGDITVSFRLWRRPRVRPGGRCSVGPAQVEVDAVELMPLPRSRRPISAGPGNATASPCASARPMPARSPTIRCCTGWSSTSSGDRRGEHPYRRERRSRGASALPSRHDVPATWRAPALITRRPSLRAGTPTHAPWPWPGHTGTISAVRYVVIRRAHDHRCRAEGGVLHVPADSVHGGQCSGSTSAGAQGSPGRT
jgi:hypothetical protein